MSISSFFKKAVEKYNSVSLILRIVIGLIAGAVLGLAAPALTGIGVLGDLFVGALKAVAPVLVFVLVSSALAQGGNKLDSRFSTVLFFYIISTLLASVVGVVGSFMFPQTIKLAETAEADVIPAGIGEVMGNLLKNMVSNPITAISEGRYIGILFWAVVFGFAMRGVASDTTNKMLVNIADAVSRTVRWIINLAPFGIMGLVFTNVSTNGLSIFTDYGKLLGLLVGSSSSLSTTVGRSA